MSKAVLISIRPEWCELILSGAKTIEVRKDFPYEFLVRGFTKSTPFKCYIYCTKGKKNADGSYRHYYWKDRTPRAFCGGTVVAEFVCDRPTVFTYGAYAVDYDMDCGEYAISKSDLKATCLSISELEEYGQEKHLVGWHISELVIYDEPKELSDFMKPCDPDPDGIPLCLQCKRLVENYGCGGTILRPPQSWCYVEELS